MAKYLFNGIELPQLPEWDKEKYPYAYIGRGQNIFFEYQYTLYLTEKPLVFAFGILCNSDMYYTTYNCKEEQISNGVWSIVTEDKHGAISGAAASPSVWSNYDIYEEDSTTVIYLAASDPIPTKYLYNDVELPVLPEWDRKAYPYVIIAYTTDPSYTLYFSTTPFYHDYFYQNNADGASCIKYNYDADADAWINKVTHTGKTQLLQRMYILWSNHDIIERSTTASVPQGTIILAGSEYTIPPIEPETPDPLPITPYLPKNGAWVKHDIYKQVGNSWVKQPQGAVEVEDGAWSALS